MFLVASTNLPVLAKHSKDFKPYMHTIHKYILVLRRRIASAVNKIVYDFMGNTPAIDQMTFVSKILSESFL